MDLVILERNETFFNHIILVDFHALGALHFEGGEAAIDDGIVEVVGDASRSGEDKAR